MWHTNNGDRTLEGAEARLFAYTLWDFLCELEIESRVSAVHDTNMLMRSGEKSLLAKHIMQGFVLLRILCPSEFKVYTKSAPSQIRPGTL